MGDPVADPWGFGGKVPAPRAPPVVRLPVEWQPGRRQRPARPHEQEQEQEQGRQLREDPVLPRRVSAR